MRLQISKSKNATSYYVIKSYRENGHNTSKVVEKLGTREQIMARTGCEDPEAWARAYIEELNKKEKFYIELYQTVDFGYNSQAGVNG